MLFVQHRHDAAKQVVGFAIQTGGKVERVGHAGPAAIPKRKAPQTINGDGLMATIVFVLMFCFIQFLLFLITLFLASLWA